jgi:hypothetical protein
LQPLSTTRRSGTSPAGQPSSCGGHHFKGWRWSVLTGVLPIDPLHVDVEPLLRYAIGRASSRPLGNGFTGRCYRRRPGRADRTVARPSLRQPWRGH